MFKHFFVVILLFLTTHTLAQTTISGKIVDEKTNKGISGASVYLNNSTYGGQTDADGNFSFNCTLLDRTSLIISHIAYERKVELITPDKIKNLIFSLKPQVNNLNEVVIKSKYKREDIVKWNTLFVSNLIGVYQGSSDLTKLGNYDALYFDFDQSTNTLQAFAKEPLIIENDFLNYRIRIDLDQFEYNFNTDEIIFKYFAFYENSPRKILTARQIRKNRIFAYEGSNMHFMRQVFKNNLDNEGFVVNRYQADLNKEKARVERMVRQKSLEMYTKYANPDVSLNRLFSGDTLKYYKQVLAQESMLNIKLSPVSINKLTKKDKITATVNFNSPDTLVVIYDINKSTLEQRIAAGMNKDRLDPKSGERKTIAKPKYLYTYMYFFKPNGINIRANGYYSELSLFMWGDMDERRLAVSVPYNFDVTSP